MNETWTQRIERYLAEGRTVSGGKGDDTAKEAETNQLAFTKTLQQAFTQQFGAAQGVLNFLNGKLQAIVDNPQGMSPEALAAARTNAIERTANDYAQAQHNVNNQIAARGGSTLPSGVQAQIEGQIGAAGAAEKSSLLNDITLQNEQMKQENYWRAIGDLSHVADAYNPTGYAGAANQGSNATASLSEAYTNSENAGWFNQFAGGLGRGLGQGLGAFASGGLSMETGWGYNGTPKANG